MTKGYADSLNFIKQLDATDVYYNREDIYWYNKDPSVLFVIRPDGDILLRHAFTDQSLSIYELWKHFNSEQKKIIAFNIDKFK